MQNVFVYIEVEGTVVAEVSQELLTKGRKLANQLGVKQVNVVANKIRDEKDEEFIRAKIPEEDLLGFIHYNPEIMDADRNGCSPYDYSRKLLDEVRAIKDRIDRIACENTES